MCTGQDELDVMGDDDLHELVQSSHAVSWSDMKGTDHCTIGQKRALDKLFEEEPSGMAVHGTERIVQENELGRSIDRTGKGYAIFDTLICAIPR